MRYAYFNLQSADGRHAGEICFGVDSKFGIVTAEINGITLSKELRDFFVEHFTAETIMTHADCVRFGDPCVRAKAERELSLERAAQDEQDFQFVASDA